APAPARTLTPATAGTLPDPGVAGRPEQMERSHEFALAVIGSGPGGRKAAIMAAELGERDCVIGRRHPARGRVLPGRDAAAGCSRVRPRTVRPRTVRPRTVRPCPR